MYIKINNYYFIIDLMKVTSQCYTPNPNVVLLDSVYDVRSWIGPHIDDLHGHSQPHCFRFSLDESGTAVMHYRNWTTDAWSKEGIQILKV